MDPLTNDPAAVYTEEGVALLPYRPERRSPEEVVRRARAFHRELDNRRSVRMFSPDPVPREAIDLAIRAASTAPSGAHQQPWTWVVVGDAETKHRMRLAAEREERVNYEGGRMSAEWKAALGPIGTNAQKPYLDIVPWIVVGFEQIHGLHADGSVRKHYYAKQSMGIACGLFLAAIQAMGLATLSHTPSPMAFLSTLLRRPAHEKPFIVFPVGFPAEDCVVPDLTRKSLAEVSVSWPGSAT